MIKQQIIDRYSSLDLAAKVRFLARVSYELTIGLRGVYDSPELADRVKRLMGANELQHHLSAELLHHHDQDEERYPDDILINILLEKAGSYGISHELQYAIEKAIQAAFPVIN